MGVIVPRIAVSVADASHQTAPYRVGDDIGARFEVVDGPGLDDGSRAGVSWVPNFWMVGP
jgi:hypothetical protein